MVENAILKAEYTATTEELIYRRHEEILIKDKEYQRVNQVILNLEKRFRQTLSEEQLKIFNEYEKVVMDSSTYIGDLLYKQGCAYKICQ